MVEDKQSPAPRKRRTGTSRKLLRWHRRFGTGFSIIFLIICITGLMLNHTEGLKLSQKTIDSNWLLNWYGMQPSTSIRSYQVNSDHLSTLEDTLYFNGEPIDSIKEFVAVAANKEFLLAAGSNDALLLTNTGDLIERLGQSGIPNSEILKAGTTTTGQIVLETADGQYIASSDFLDWTQASEPLRVSHLATVPTPDAIEKQILESYRGEGLSLYRFILDLHSGRFFGGAGRLVVDLTAVAMIFLTLSGLYYTFFLRRR